MNTPEQIRNELDQDEPRSSFPQYHMQSRQDRDAELVAYDQMSRESAQNRTLGASEPVWAPEGHPDAAGAYEALVQQIAEAIDGAPDGTDPVMGDWRDWINEARAVVPLVEAQVAPLRDEANGLRRMYRDNLQHLRAERDWWRHSHERWYDAAMEAAQGEAAAESALRQVREDLTALADEWEGERKFAEDNGVIDGVGAFTSAFVLGIAARDLRAVLDAAVEGAS